MQAIFDRNRLENSKNFVKPIVTLVTNPQRPIYLSE